MNIWQSCVGFCEMGRFQEKCHFGSIGFHPVLKIGPQSPQNQFLALKWYSAIMLWPNEPILWFLAKSKILRYLVGDFTNFDDFTRKIRNLSKCRPPFNHGYWMLFLKKPNQVVQSGSAAAKSCSRFQLAVPWDGVSRIFWVGFENIVGQLNHYNKEETYRQTSCIKCWCSFLCHTIRNPSKKSQTVLTKNKINGKWAGRQFKTLSH